MEVSGRGRQGVEMLDWRWMDEDVLMGGIYTLIIQ